MNLSDIQNATHGKFETLQDGVFVELELSKVYPNPNQPRKDFHNIEELAATIKEDGLLQPIVVVKDEENRYMILAGERRYRACKHLQKSTIKAHIIVADEKKVQELAFVENIQRDDLTDFEIAKYINQLWASGHYGSKKELAIAIGKSQSYLSKAFKAVKLCDEIISDIEEHKRDIGLEILQELSGISNPQLQLELYERDAKRNEIRKIANDIKSSSESYSRQMKQISPAKKSSIIFEEKISSVWGMSELMTKIINKMLENNEDGSYKIIIEEI